ncbi:MAG: 4-hydroxy-tetrahydrodipicolinate synthase [Orrella sp.]
MTTSNPSIQKLPYGGSMVALVTPMHPDGTLDLASYRNLIDWHIEQGTDALVVVGTSGESPTVSMDEHAELIEIAVAHADDRIPVIAGVGANSTAEAIELAQYARNVGVKAGLSVVPYYNKPSQEGIYRHFVAVQEAVDLPTFLYNVPGRTVADISHDTVMRLTKVPGIIGIKDATGDIGRGALLIRETPPDFHILSGDDATAAALIMLGGHGNVSVTANVAPRAMHDLCVAAASGDVVTARALNAKLAVLNKLLFVEGNPIPVKWALSQMGRIPGGIRLPLCELSPQFHEPLRAALLEAGLL